MAQSWSPIRLIGYLLGYGEETLPEGGGPPLFATTASLLSTDGQTLLRAFARDLFQASPRDLSVTPQRDQVRLEPWWEAIDTPHLKDSDVSDGWTELARRGHSCDVLAWTAASCVPEVTDWFSEAVLRFQSQETIVAADDAFPLQWGAVAYQAFGAAWQVEWLIRARLAGTSDGQLVSVRRLLHRWFESASAQWVDPTTNQPQVLAGDLVLLHLLYSRLAPWLPHLSAGQATARAAHEAAQARVKEAKEFQDRFWQGPASRWARRRLVTAERVIERTAARRLGLVENALAEASVLLERWRALSPLSRVAVAGSSSPQASVTPFRLAVLVQHRHAQGVQEWFVRRLVHRSLVPGSPAADGEVLRVLQDRELVPEQDPLRGLDDSWLPWLFLLRFYRLWGRSWLLSGKAPELPPAETAGLAEARVQQWTAFFTPWNRWQLIRRGLTGSDFSEGETAHRCLKEYGRWFDEPLQRPASWLGDDVRTLADGINYLARRLTGQIRVTPQPAASALAPTA